MDYKDDKNRCDPQGRRWPEVLTEGGKVLKRVAELSGQFQFQFTYFPWGCEYYLEHGYMMDADGMERLT